MTHTHTLYHITEAGGQHVAFATSEADAHLIIDTEYPPRYRHQATITPVTIEFPEQD